MKRKLLIFIITCTYICINGQLDREHWFAPMFNRTNLANNYQSLYFSTGETAPFKVDIWHDNRIIGTVIISRNNPAKFDILNSETIISTEDNDLFRPVAMGLYAKGEKPFFATLRFSVYNHAEIQTSKGKAGLGKEFRAVMAPIVPRNHILNFMNSIMATEDNTNVTINGFNPNIVFADNTSRTEINFTLNRGQSYIVEGSGLYDSNSTGYIGAKITADKPVVIANGNFNGQYAQDISTSSDILMDQGVPEDKLGQEFILVKGNGSITSNMEKALIVATQNNTKVYLNDQIAPSATLNAGQFYLTDNNAYKNQGGGHYSMFIRTDKNSYVYQLLGGTDGNGTSPLATGGFNFIPPLSCYLPRKIVEIGRISENEYSSNNAQSLTVPTKLNIITEKGAQIKIERNGIEYPLMTSNGPYAVTGNPRWETYSVQNITGNIAIYSSGAVTAGISAGNDAVGYGGFFAGFSLIPLITKIEGECIPHVKLAVPEGFAQYRWVIKKGNVYEDAPGQNNLFYYAPSKEGIYAVQIQQGTCPQVQTADFTFFNCTDYTNIPYKICSEISIEPAFALSSQQVDPATIQIISQPTLGSATVDNGKIIYAANPNTTGTDRFQYRFCGVSSIPDCEVAQATIEISPIIAQDTTLVNCTTAGSAIFNLTTAQLTQDDSSLSKKYYLTRAGAESQNETEEIPNFTNYQSTGQDIFVRLESTDGCVAIAKITLIVENVDAHIYSDQYTVLHCDEDVDYILDGIYKVKLSEITPYILTNPAAFTVKYYESETKAIAGLSDYLNDIYSFTTQHKIWVRAEPKAGCPAVISSITLKIGNKLPLLQNTVIKEICSITPETPATVDLAQYQTGFTLDPDAQFTYFYEEDDARKNLNPIASTAVQVSGSQAFFLRIGINGSCQTLAKLQIKVKNTLAPEEQVEICPAAKAILPAPTGYTSYLWSTGEISQSISAEAGEYYVDYKTEDCTYRKYFKVQHYTIPVINSVEITGSTVRINASGGTAPYTYSLDGKQYQNSNEFINIQPGSYTAYVRGKEECQPTTYKFTVVRLLNVITPDENGKNDFLDYSSLLGKEKPDLQIADRYGNVVFTGNSSNNFSWDATHGGKKVASGMYWFLLRWTEPNTSTVTEHKGWVLVKYRK